MPISGSYSQSAAKMREVAGLNSSASVSPLLTTVHATEFDADKPAEPAK